MSVSVVLRSLVYTLWLYGGIVLFSLLGAPWLLASRRAHMPVVRGWARSQIWGLRIICGVRVEQRGLEHRPTGPALIAGKHQGMLDIIAPFAVLDDPCFVLKKELMALPFFGWHAWKTDMLPVDRAAGASALKKMVAGSRARLADGRQILIFPEGTRQEPGAPPAYKPGVAALYKELGVPCVPMATNSGVHWPPHGFIRRPGTVVFEFLPPIPPGLKRAEFMGELQTRLEAASDALLRPAPKDKTA